MTIKEGWEVSPDRIKMFEKMLNTFPIGDPVITSKCVLDNDNGFLVVSDNGFSWKIKLGAKDFMGPGGRIGGMAKSGKSKWVRWYDVANITPKKNGQILAHIKIRKKGALKLDKKGNYKVRKWKLTIRKNKGEQKPQWKQRLETFNTIMLEIFSRNAVEEDPPTSDSQI